MVEQVAAADHHSSSPLCWLEVMDGWEVVGANAGGGAPPPLDVEATIRDAMTDVVRELAPASSTLPPVDGGRLFERKHSQSGHGERLQVTAARVIAVKLGVEAAPVRDLLMSALRRPGRFRDDQVEVAPSRKAAKAGILYITLDAPMTQLEPPPRVAPTLHLHPDHATWNSAYMVTTYALDELRVATVRAANILSAKVKEFVDEKAAAGHPVTVDTWLEGYARFSDAELTRTGSTLTQLATDPWHGAMLFMQTWALKRVEDADGAVLTKFWKRCKLRGAFPNVHAGVIKGLKRAFEKVRHRSLLQHTELVSICNSVERFLEAMPGVQASTLNFVHACKVQASDPEFRREGGPPVVPFPRVPGSAVSGTGAVSFVGDATKYLQELLPCDGGGRRMVCIHGPPGHGKTRVVDELVFGARAVYRSGVFRIEADSLPALHAGLRGDVIANVPSLEASVLPSATPTAMAKAIREWLGSRDRVRVALVLDNVDDDTILPFVVDHLLPGPDAKVDVIVTSRLPQAAFPPAMGCTFMEMTALRAEAAMHLLWTGAYGSNVVDRDSFFIESHTDLEAASREAAAVRHAAVDLFAGVPLFLVAAAAQVRTSCVSSFEALLAHHEDVMDALPGVPVVSPDTALGKWDPFTDAGDIAVEVLAGHPKVSTVGRLEKLLHNDAVASALPDQLVASVRAVASHWRQVPSCSLQLSLASVGASTKDVFFVCCLLHPTTTPQRLVLAAARELGVRPAGARRALQHLGQRHLVQHDNDASPTVSMHRCWQDTGLAALPGDALPRLAAAVIRGLAAELPPRLADSVEWGATRTRWQAVLPSVFKSEQCLDWLPPEDRELAARLHLAAAAAHIDLGDAPSAANALTVAMRMAGNSPNLSVSVTTKCLRAQLHKARGEELEEEEVVATLIPHLSGDGLDGVAMVELARVASGCLSVATSDPQQLHASCEALLGGATSCGVDVRVLQQHMRLDCSYRLRAADKPTPARGVLDAAIQADVLPPGAMHPLRLRLLRHKFTVDESVEMGDPLEVLRATLGDEPSLDAAKFLSDAALKACNMGSHDAAIALNTRAIDMYRTVLGGDVFLGVARIRFNLAAVHEAREDFERAMETYKAVRVILDTVLAGKDHPEAAKVASGLGICMVQLHHPDAVAMCQTAVQMARRLAGSMSQRHLGRALERLAHAYGQAGDTRAAVEEMKEAVGVFRSLGDSDAVWPYLRQVAIWRVWDLRDRRGVDDMEAALVAAQEAGDVKACAQLEVEVLQAKAAVRDVVLRANKRKLGVGVGVGMGAVFLYIVSQAVFV